MATKLAAILVCVGLGTLGSACKSKESDPTTEPKTAEVKTTAPAKEEVKKVEPAPEAIKEKVAAVAVDASIPAPKADPAVKPASPAAVVHQSATEASEWLKGHSDTIVLDVRTPKEFAEGHIEGAVNVDFLNENFSTELKALDTSKTYVMHCRSGGRSSKALQTFSDLGFQHILHMDGGMNAWKAAGLPTK